MARFPQDADFASKSLYLDRLKFCRAGVHLCAYGRVVGEIQFFIEAAKKRRCAAHDFKFTAGVRAGRNPATGGSKRLPALPAGLVLVIHSQQSVAKRPGEHLVSFPMAPSLILFTPPGSFFPYIWIRSAHLAPDGDI